NPRLVRLLDTPGAAVLRWHLPDLMSKLGLSLGAAAERRKQPDEAGSVTIAHSPNLIPSDYVSENVIIPADILSQKPAAKFASILEENSLASGIKDSWFGKLSPEQKDEVVDYALGIIAERSNILRLTANGGDNLKYYAITTAVAVSGAPHAEEIFVKHASA